MEVADKRMDGVFRLGGDVDTGVEEFGEDFETGDKARAGAGKIAVGVEIEDLFVADGGNLPPLMRKAERAIFVAGLFGGVTARGDDQDLWLRVDDLLTRDAKRRRAGPAENVDTAGKFDHLGHPVAADINGLEPFKESAARPPHGLRYFALDSGKFFADGLQQALGFVAMKGFIANPKNVPPHVAEIKGIEAEQFRARIEGGENLGEIFWRGGTDVA